MGAGRSIPKQRPEFERFIRALGDAVGDTVGFQLSSGGRVFTIENEEGRVLLYDKQNLPRAVVDLNPRMRNPGKTLLAKVPIDVKRNPRLVERIVIQFLTPEKKNLYKVASKPLLVRQFYGVATTLPFLHWKWRARYRLGDGDIQIFTTFR